MNETIGFAWGIASAKSNIAHAKSKYEGGRNSTEEVLMTCRECVKRKNKQFVQVKGTLLNHLQPTVGGAWDLLTKLLATSKQVLGPHTKEVTSGLEWVVAQREISKYLIVDGVLFCTCNYCQI